MGNTPSMEYMTNLPVAKSPKESDSPSLSRHLCCGAFGFQFQFMLKLWLTFSDSVNHNGHEFMCEQPCHIRRQHVTALLPTLQLWHSFCPLFPDVPLAKDEGDCCRLFSCSWAPTLTWSWLVEKCVKEKCCSAHLTRGEIYGENAALTKAETKQIYGCKNECL